ncbi:uncharacterized protein [Leptinotarsa decemlineata]|uniref:uncharacterized protein n=1 Tax=Leptinotarsa decemlineata TaxID=7539 RepID=UPI000C252853|nr:neuropeptide-like 4 [Leptinotarsa decemlineata]
MFKLVLVVSATLTVICAAPAPVPNPKPRPQYYYSNLYSSPYVAPGLAYTSGLIAPLTYNAPVEYSGLPAYVAPSVNDNAYAYAALPYSNDVLLV